jgi:hypothetical protein
LVGHKIFVVAEEDLFLDNFMVKLEEARKSSWMLWETIRVAWFSEWAWLVRSIRDSTFQRQRDVPCAKNLVHGRRAFMRKRLLIECMAKDTRVYEPAKA